MIFFPKNNKICCTIIRQVRVFDNFFQVGFLYTNITTIKTQLTTIRETLSSIGPDMEIVHADMNGFKNDVDSLTAQLSVMGDPAR